MIMRSNHPTIQIEPAAGGISLFVPIEPEALTICGYQELILRAQQAMLAYLAVMATEQLPVIA